MGWKGSGQGTKDRVLLLHSSMAFLKKCVKLYHKIQKSINIKEE